MPDRKTEDKNMIYAFIRHLTNYKSAFIIIISYKLQIELKFIGFNKIFLLE